MIKPIKMLTHRKRENAQTMVEFALVFPIILLITYGIIEFGRLLFIYAAVTGASREGARYGAAAGDLGGNLTRYYMDCDGILDAVQRGAILTPINNSDVFIWYDRGPETAHIKNSCPPQDANGKDLVNMGDRIGVHVMAHYSPMIPFLGLNGFDINSENARTILVNVDVVGTPLPPAPSNTPTRTPGPSSTYGPTPTRTRTPTVTQTGTETLTPTITQTYDLTHTPTITPTPACIINGGPLSFTSNYFSWTTTSLSTHLVRLIEANVDWPTTDPLILLNDLTIIPNSVWNGASPPPASISSWMGDASRRELQPGRSHTLRFWYSDILPLDPGMSYSVTVTYRDTFSGETCSVSQGYYIPATPTTTPTVNPYP